MDTRKRTGRKGEEAAEAFLAGQGVTILERNFRSKFGEIDLIGLDGSYLIIVEVKTRMGKGSGMPAEAVGYHKRKKICMAFNYYRMIRHLTEDTPVRFDVIEVDERYTCHWIQNAFEYLE